VTDLRPELIEKCRRYVRINRDNHPWADMDDLQLLKSAQLYQEDPETKQNGVTLAGAMLFAPYPKTPVIGAFFREIDRADELDSGMRKMMMYGKKYGGSDPPAHRRGCFSHDHQCAGIWRKTREDG
jgi:predicted HTH transcriptional regulator